MINNRIYFVKNSRHITFKKTWVLFFQYSPGGEGSFELVYLKIRAGDTAAFCRALLRISCEIKPESRLTIGLQ